MMSSLGEELELLQQIATDLQTSRYLAAASFVALTWDILISLEDEITLIWKAPWSMGKVLFFITRYPTLLEALVWLARSLDRFASNSFCFVAAQMDAWTSFVFIIPIQLIVVLRTIALWDNRRAIVVLLVLLLLATDATMATAIALVTKTLVFKPNPSLQPVLGCDSGFLSLNSRVTVPAWTALMVFDTGIFILTFIGIMQKIRYGWSRLLSILVRDGFAYYALMLVTSVANLVMYSALPLKRRGLLDSMIQVLRCTMSIIGSRILLNFRGVVNGRQSGPSHIHESSGVSHGFLQEDAANVGGSDSLNTATTTAASA